MKVLIQRVKYAKVDINDENYSSIGSGILAFVGIEKGDSADVVEKLAGKIVNLRIMDDENNVMNKKRKSVSKN